ncbi:alpha/beta hydrolase fold containing protein [Spirochaeta thermophila DSM 6578]|uniref:Alpha/beta hydrolase fold containing protein n=1 Tax=Winmispira thermophila (strain ATCC 700085 / DSM 6578 / Z-1203) TaxID=869211 RepID=G0GB40_WINT7|nr:alpha/beta hydrolase [Spirochaeta thermophila]AEJ61064.1 alpha/beta hydrolase fold containing protein [Spirochaeta thermophila DSM 6578]
MSGRAGKTLRVLLLVTGVLTVVVLAFGVYIVRYEVPENEVLIHAGITEKTTVVGEVSFNYVEGPTNGPALLLLHAQTLDWHSYRKVLPDLGSRFHVFAVTYPGHGKTTVPDDYPMTAERIGTDLATFIETIIGEPVYATGNSAGGLLAVWLAANRPDLIRAIALEDPPLFSSEYPEVRRTVSYKLFRKAHEALRDPGFDGDFLDYWVQHGKEFFSTYTGPLSQYLLRLLVSLYRALNPGKPLELPFLPVTVQEMLRGLDRYDARFGASFYTGEWNRGFDHAEALQRITCPVLLIHANFDYLEDDTLNGAMTQEQAEHAVSLLGHGADVRYERVDSAHVVHLERPGLFVRMIEDFFLMP